MTVQLLNDQIPHSLSVQIVKQSSQAHANISSIETLTLSISAIIAPNTMLSGSGDALVDPGGNTAKYIGTVLHLRLIRT